VDDQMRIAVAGAHLEGQPLNHQLTDRGAVLVERTRTGACYRMYALATDPLKPGLVRVPSTEEGASIEVEVWALLPSAFAELIDEVPAPLVIGRVLLADGTDVPGFLCEPIALLDALDITAFGGWRAYRASEPPP
jgi:allophanate hydrolase